MESFIFSFPSITSWDGTQNNEPLNTGIFAYKVLVITDDGQEIEKSGSLTLVK